MSGPNPARPAPPGPPADRPVLVAARRHADRVQASAEVYGVRTSVIAESRHTLRLTAVAENGDHLIVRFTESYGNLSKRFTATTRAAVTTEADRTERPIKVVSIVLWLQNHRKEA